MCDRITVKPYNVPFVIKTPDGDLSQTGVEELEVYLYETLNFPILPEDFEFTWVTRRGTLPKRIQAFYHKHGEKLEPSQISEIGNIAKRHSSIGAQFTLDFTNKISWQDGAFGDAGSCFWSERTGAKTMIEQNGCAVRAYRLRNPDGSKTAYDNLRGYARAWVAPIEGNRLIVFNGYGETSLVFARLLALKFGTNYKKIGLMNNGNDGGVLYINGYNFVLGDNIHEITNWDLGWEDCRCHEDDDDDDEHTEACYSCGERYYGEDMWYITVAARGTQAYVCSDCSYDCAKCLERVYHRFSFRYEGARYCETCYNEITEPALPQLESEVA